MSNERRAGIYTTTLAIVALFGAEACTNPTLAPPAEPTPAVKQAELSSFVYPDNLRRVLVWDILLDSGYQRLFDNKGKPMPYAFVGSQDSITIRVDKSAFTFNSQFDNQKTLAYMWNWDNEFHKHFTVDQLDEIFGSLRPGEDMQSMGTGITDVATAAEIISDDMYIYAKFNRGGIRDGDVWMVVFRKGIFNNLKENAVGITFGGVIRFTSKTKA